MDITQEGQPKSSDAKMLGGVAALLAGVFAGSAHAAETADLTPDQLTALEKETRRIGMAFMKAWEKPKAEELVEFFAIPCEIKYGHSADVSFFTKKEDLLALLKKTISDDRVWFFDPIVSMVEGNLIISDTAGGRGLPGQAPSIDKRGRLIFLTHIVGGKIRQWVDISYLDV
jgi:hypothetical protein